MSAYYNLKAPLYVGDTAGDCRSSHAAGIDFAWARYGFGHHVSGAEQPIDSITQLCESSSRHKMKRTRKPQRHRTAARRKQKLRLRRICDIMGESGIEAILVHDKANIYYLTGRVFAGYILVSRKLDSPLYFVRRPNHLEGRAAHIRKPEEITGTIAAQHRSTVVALEA